MRVTAAWEPRRYIEDMHNSRDAVAEDSLHGSVLCVADALFFVVLLRTVAQKMCSCIISILFATLTSKLFIGSRVTMACIHML